MTEQPRVFDPELTKLSYPRPVQFYELESQSHALRMAYMVAEPERFNGHTVILLHGKNFSGAYWEPTISSLAGRGFRVVAPDQIGFGKSSKPHAYQFTFQALAENTRGLLDHLGVGARARRRALDGWDARDAIRADVPRPDRQARTRQSRSGSRTGRPSSRT